MDKADFKIILEYYFAIAEQARKAAKTVNPADLTPEVRELQLFILNVTGNSPKVEPRRQAELIRAFD